MKLSSLAFVLAGLVFAAPFDSLAFAQGGAADQPIRNFLKVSTDFCTGGQPRMEHFAQLKADVSGRC